jgi:hypothetical protein
MWCSKMSVRSDLDWNVTGEFEVKNSVVFLWAEEMLNMATV